jgi:KDO2-lipid IV(A) lauroyltransferase
MAASPSPSTPASLRAPAPGGRAGEPPVSRAGRLAGLALRAAAGALQRMPGRLAYALADLAAPALMAASLLHERRVAPLGRGLSRNLRIVFRERLGRREARRLLFAWARHTTWLVVDFCRMPRLRARDLGRRVDARAFDEVFRLAAQGRGVICVSGHLGVWEMCATVVGLRGHPITLVVRPTGFAPLDDLLDSIRSAAGARAVSKHGVLLRLARALERGEMVGLLADEDAGERAIFAPFLGTLAATTPSVAFLQRLTGAPIVVASVHRVGRERWRCHLWRVIPFQPDADPERGDREVTRAVNEALSRAILAHPEQWLWGSRRFLTRPPGERPGPDGLPPRAG